jgi:azurin
VTLEGTVDHNFFIGAAEDLAARRYERLVGEHVWSGGTREVRYTFQPGQTLQFACTLSGHYGPMHGEFVVEG